MLEKRRTCASLSLAIVHWNISRSMSPPPHRSGPAHSGPPEPNGGGLAPKMRNHGGERASAALQKQAMLPTHSPMHFDGHACSW
eukprot:9481271-Pyramimonas_sp.AAC.1